MCDVTKMKQMGDDRMDGFDPKTWEAHLSACRLGHGENLVLDRIDSTNTQARRMALAGAVHGSLCLSETQTAGKGRLGRSWESPAGRGLWLSVILRPALKPEQAPLITLCAAMAMAQAVFECTGLEAGIKWPNDLVYDGRKICGVLLEISATVEKIDYIVVGTGLNVRTGAYSPQLRERAAALEEFAAPPPRQELLLHYLRALDALVARVEQQGFAGIREAYAAHSCTIGRAVRVTGAVEMTGRAEGIDESGALLVRTEDGTLHRVLAGDVSVRGVMGYV